MEHIGGTLYAFAYNFTALESAGKRPLGRPWHIGKSTNVDITKIQWADVDSIYQSQAGDSHKHGNEPSALQNSLTR
jgi:hypothetical protein